MKTIISSLTLSVLLLVTSCSKVPITGRRQFNVVPDNMITEMSLSSYNQFLSEHNVVPASNDQVKMLRRVGQRISTAVEDYFRNNGMADAVKGYKWEFNLVESPEVNAWAMPGGKVVFYTGILPLTKDEAGIAVVMGHEIAHAVVNHGGERMSQQLAIALGGVTLDVALQKEPDLTRNIFNTVYGVGSQLGTLAYSRTHEYEADKLGMVFMAMAGYDPHRAASFWQEMAALGGQAPPEFLSTHPSNANRIKEINKYMPTAMKYFR
ncbi:MAG: M48 family metallopeptidase [Lentimicrobiaceae bacterium]|nr:M48 family metallopeptidase [Lentimicrobiaceae bacterium]